MNAVSPDPESPAAFQAELLRLRNEVTALSQANVRAAQLLADLEEARVLEQKLKANNLRLQQAQQMEESRGRFLEQVALNQPEEALAVAFGELLRHQAPDQTFAILLAAGDEMRLADTVGLSAPLSLELASLQFAAEASIRRAMATRHPVSVLNLGEGGMICRALYDHGYRTLVCFPALSSTGRVLGALCLIGMGPQEPGEQQWLAMESACRLFSMGLSHRKMTERLTYQAHHDTLTSLPNRAYFYETLHDAVAASERSGRKFAVLWADLDRFKQINDSVGHHAADLLLQMVAQRLRDCVGTEGTIARMGGDEFAVLVRDTDAIEQAEAVAQKILATAGEPFGFGENQCSMGMSIGISLYPDHGEDSEELVRNADLAMYSAKHAGRNTFVSFTRDTATQSLETFQIEFHLRRALELGEMELYFQPLISCKNGTIEAFETLLRWFCPALGAVSPAQFIPVAEAAGLMPGIGKWVLENACLHAAAWQQAAPGVRVAVNVAAPQLMRGDFGAIVENALATSRLSPSLLELELTESAVMDPENVQRWIAELRQLGVSLAIDDFGTGYSSLSYLHHLDVDTLKVDRSFVQALGKEAASARLAETIIQMAKSLSLKVVAEGIETPEQMEWLTNLGCDLLQGYYLYRPMPIPAVFALLDKQTHSATTPALRS